MGRRGLIGPSDAQAARAKVTNHQFTQRTQSLRFRIVNASTYKQRERTSRAQRSLNHTTVLPLPLAISRVAFLTDHETKGLLQQTHVMLEQGFAPDISGRLNPTTTHIMRTVVSEPCLLNGFGMSQLIRNKVVRRRSDARETQAILVCHAETVKLVNQRLDNPDTACDDINILAVMTLAINDITSLADLDSEPEHRAQQPNQGPLRSLRHLNLYGSILKFVPLHRQGMAMMVEKRGGIQNITFPGLAPNIT